MNSLTKVYMAAIKKYQKERALRKKANDAHTKYLKAKAALAKADEAHHEAERKLREAHYKAEDSYDELKKKVREVVSDSLINFTSEEFRDSEEEIYNNLVTTTGYDINEF